MAPCAAVRHAPASAKVTVFYTFGVRLNREESMQVQEQLKMNETKSKANAHP